MHYFAYGSNMNHEQMKRRCPSSEFVKKTYLEGYRFVYDGYSCTWKGAVANIIKSPGDIVWGGLFEINRDNLAALDCYEGCPKYYDKGAVVVRDEEGFLCKATTYLRTGKNQGEPSKKYRTIVVQGARDCSLPEEYTRENLDK